MVRSVWWQCEDRLVGDKTGRDATRERNEKTLTPGSRTRNRRAFFVPPPHRNLFAQGHL